MRQEFCRTLWMSTPVEENFNTLLVKSRPLCQFNAEGMPHAQPCGRMCTGTHTLTTTSTCCRDASCAVLKLCLESVSVGQPALKILFFPWVLTCGLMPKQPKSIIKRSHFCPYTTSAMMPSEEDGHKALSKTCGRTKTAPYSKE